MYSAFPAALQALLQQPSSSLEANAPQNHHDLVGKLLLLLSRRNGDRVLREMVVRQLEQAGLTPSRQTLVNLPSRVRMATLYAVAQTVEQGIVINTSNLSEDWVGYCTIYGDSAGAFSPLGMYTTEEVIALGRVLGLPEKFLVKAPSDGLTGLTDEDNLGFTYHAVNEYVRRGVCDPAIRAQIDRKHRTSRFKFQTLPVYHNGLPMALTDETDYYK